MISTEKKELIKAPEAWAAWETSLTCSEWAEVDALNRAALKRVNQLLIKSKSPCKICITERLLKLLLTEIEFAQSVKD